MKYTRMDLGSNYRELKVTIRILYDTNIQNMCLFLSYFKLK